MQTREMSVSRVRQIAELGAKNNAQGGTFRRVLCEIHDFFVWPHLRAVVIFGGWFYKKNRLG